jgi:hypothetical protein
MKTYYLVWIKNDAILGGAWSEAEAWADARRNDSEGLLAKYEGGDDLECIAVDEATGIFVEEQGDEALTAVIAATTK